MKDKDFNPTSIIEGVRFRFRPDGTELDNLTSRQFLTRAVVPSAVNIVNTVERTIDGKVRKVQTLTSLDDFRNPAST